MAKFNIDRIRQIVGEINRALAKLQAISKFTEKEFLASTQNVDSAKYNLIVIIEGAIDICNHIVARKGGRTPCDYADCFAILGEMGIFSDDFVERLKKIAKFRNLLVHLYWQVDDARVYKFIREDILDIKRYLQGINKVIQE